MLGKMVLVQTVPSVHKKTPPEWGLAYLAWLASGCFPIGSILDRLFKKLVFKQES